MKLRNLVNDAFSFRTFGKCVFVLVIVLLIFSAIESFVFSRRPSRDVELNDNLLPFMLRLSSVSITKNAGVRLCDTKSLPEAKKNTIFEAYEKFKLEYINRYKHDEHFRKSSHEISVTSRILVRYIETIGAEHINLYKKFPDYAVNRLIEEFGFDALKYFYDCFESELYVSPHTISTHNASDVTNRAYVFDAIGKQALWLKYVQAFIDYNVPFVNDGDSSDDRQLRFAIKHFIKER